MVNDDEPASGEAPIELYDIVTAELPLNVVPDAAPAPPLFIVSAFVIFAVIVISADPLNATPLILRDVAKIVAVAALPE